MVLDDPKLRQDRLNLYVACSATLAKIFYAVAPCIFELMFDLVVAIQYPSSSNPLRSRQQAFELFQDFYYRLARTSHRQISATWTLIDQIDSDLAATVAEKFQDLMTRVFVDKAYTWMSGNKVVLLLDPSSPNAAPLTAPPFLTTFMEHPDVTFAGDPADVFGCTQKCGRVYWVDEDAMDLSA